MIIKIAQYLPYILLVVFYLIFVLQKKNFVKKLSEKEIISEEDEDILMGGLMGEYMILLFGIFLISYETYRLCIVQ